MAVKVTGDPAAPLKAASAICGPEVFPNVHALLAIPSASVVEEAASDAPGTMVDHVTVAPEDGAPIPTPSTTAKQDSTEQKSERRQGRAVESGHKTR